MLNYNTYRMMDQVNELGNLPMGKKCSYKITVAKGTKISAEEVEGHIYYPFALRKSGKEWVLDHVPTGMSIMSFKLKRDVVNYLKTIDRHVYDSADMSDRETMLAWGKLREDLSKIKFFVTV